MTHFRRARVRSLACAGMGLQQRVLITSWDQSQREFVADIGGEAVVGLTNIVRLLTEHGWEIASVVALESSSAPTSASTKSDPRSRVVADVLAIFTKRSTQ